MKKFEQITEAEWKLMRILWKDYPMNSNDMINEINASTKWSPTTVKTLLSRLVNKGIIKYEVKGRSYIYYPVLTEMRCVQLEMAATLNKIYGVKLNRESEHFQFFGDADKDYISNIENALESNYYRISKDLNYEFEDKVMVHIYESQRGLHSALGLINGPKWVRAGWTWGIIHIAPEECFTEIDGGKAAVHIMAQIMITNTNPHVPHWLFQGTAAFESKWLSEERIIKTIKNNLGHVNKDTFKKITQSEDYFKNHDGYELSYTVVEYIVKTYNQTKLNDFLKSPHEYYEIFKISEDEFWKNWLDYLNERVS